MSVIIMLIERHVSAYSEAIIRFNNFQLYETNIFHGIALLDVEISSSMFVFHLHCHTNIDTHRKHSFLEPKINDKGQKLQSNSSYRTVAQQLTCNEVSLVTQTC